MSEPHKIIMPELYRPPLLTWFDVEALRLGVHPRELGARLSEAAARHLKLSEFAVTLEQIIDLYLQGAIKA